MKFYFKKKVYTKLNLGFIAQTNKILVKDIDSKLNR